MLSPMRFLVSKTMCCLVLVASLGLFASATVPASDDYDYSDTDYPEHSSLVPKSWDLAQEAQKALQNETPLLLMFSAEDCEFCQRLESEILDPMLLSGDYDDKILIRRVMTDSYLRVQDFQGRTIEMDELSSRYNIQVTPTVLIVDHQGRELAPRIIGVNTIEMYSAYLDKAIDLTHRLVQQ